MNNKAEVKVFGGRRFQGCPVDGCTKLFPPEKLEGSVSIIFQFFFDVLFFSKFIDNFYQIYEEFFDELKRFSTRFLWKFKEKNEKNFSRFFCWKSFEKTTFGHMPGCVMNL